MQTCKRCLSCTLGRTVQEEFVSGLLTACRWWCTAETLTVHISVLKSLSFVAALCETGMLCKCSVVYKWNLYSYRVDGVFQYRNVCRYSLPCNLRRFQPVCSSESLVVVVLPYKNLSVGTYRTSKLLDVDALRLHRFFDMDVPALLFVVRRFFPHQVLVH